MYVGHLDNHKNMDGGFNVGHLDNHKFPHGIEG